MFTTILLNKNDDGTTTAQVTQLDDAQLPADGDVTVRVDYSTINYKDGLAITGKAPVVRSWPMVPGIDGAGEVIASSHPDWKAGDEFILNGWGVGESHWGCLSQRAKLKGGWLIPRPPGMSARTAMAIGTAGYTAMLCAMARMRASTRSRTAGTKVRKVPSMKTLVGIWFEASPPCTCPIETTAESIGSTLRETIV